MAPLALLQVSGSVELDPIALLFQASGPVKVVNGLLLVAAAAVWVVTVLKLRQLRRLAAEERRFEMEADQAHGAGQLAEVARRHPEAPGARVVRGILLHGAGGEMASAAAGRALVTEQQRVEGMLGVLSTVGSAAPFVGLFGTVWGILDAFLRIGREKSASLEVVAPAIGEALLATALGLFAAIPAVVAFNVTSKRADDLLARVEAASAAWRVLSGRRPDPAPAASHGPAPSVPPVEGAPGWASPRAAPAAGAEGAFPTSTSRRSST